MKKNELQGRLSRFRQIKLTVTGRKSGKIISNPVWFVAEGGTLYLLPGFGHAMVQVHSQEPGDSDRCTGEEAEFQSPMQRP